MGTAEGTFRTPARRRLLDTAGRLFYAEGIHAVGIDRIIAEANVAKATLYAHFRSKEDLVAAYLQATSGEWREHVAGALAATPEDVKRRIVVPFDLLAEAVAVDGWRGCSFINAAAEYSEHQLVRRAVDEHRAWLLQTFADILDEARRPLAPVLAQLYDGAMVAAHLDRNPGAPEVARRAALALLTV